ncbi:MAG: Flp pilus assembly protein CpaB [Gammaproteobacteria bacterium]|nr:Flp pilus assembly protein CpaB [Gammaproteobacteria bacterium]
MSHRMLRVLAVLLALGSAAVGYVGYRLSQRQAVDHTAATDAVPTLPADTHPVIVAVRAIPAGRSITSEDFTLVAFPVRPANTYSKPNDIIGKTPSLAIAAGEAPLERHFLPGSSLARAVRPGERAIAVKVDEVIGGGGLVQPGDYVDVLLYLRGGNQELPKSTAQIVLKHARVLAYGEAVIGTSGEADSKESQNTAGRSAVLAVPLEHAPAVMLAASAGTLRLAVYGVEEAQAAHAQATTSNMRPLTLSELTQQRRSEPTQKSVPTVNVFHGARKEVIEAK